MLSLFQIGETYRERYRVEHVVRFFDGELAIARGESERVYLQSASLRKQAPSRAIQQYRALNHPLLLPFSEVYTEERAIVWIRPYEPIHPLREVILMREADEDQVVKWGRELLLLERELNAKAMPMYLLLDPRNIGLNERGELRVLFCGIRDITAQPPVLDWGSFFYSLLSGRFLEKPIDRLPAGFPVSRPMAQLIKRSLGGADVEDVLARIEWYERKKHGNGLFGFLFGQGKRAETFEESSGAPPVLSRKETAASAPQPGKPPSAAPETSRSGPERSRDNEADTERMRKLAEELERTGRQLLERQRKELERRQMERLERQREELRKREEELLRKQEEAFRKNESLPEQRKGHGESEKRELEEQEELETGRIAEEQQEREKIRREYEDLLRKELKELRNQRLQWEQKYRELERREQELREKLEREFEQMARELLKRQEEEFARREQEMLQRQRLWLEEQTRRKLEEQRKKWERETRRHVPDRPANPVPADVRDKEREPENDGRERLRDEKRKQENRDHEELARQFEEYMKQMYGGE